MIQYIIIHFFEERQCCWSFLYQNILCCYEFDVLKEMFIIVFNAPVMSHGYVNFLARIRVNLFSIWKNLDVSCCTTVVFFFFKISFFNIQGQIGWRTGSRRLLLFSTDSGFHYAGDGKVMRFNKQEYQTFPML